MAQIGDIVVHDEHRYTVMSRSGNAHGTTDVTLVSKHSAQALTPYHYFKRSEIGLEIYSRPEFEVGQSVRIDERNGTVVSDEGETVVIDILADERYLSSDDRYKVNLDAMPAQRIPKWKVVLENML